MSKRKQQIKQTNESTLKMLWALHNKIGQNTRFAMGTFLKSHTFRSDGYVTALTETKIVKNVGYKTQGQDWRWIGGEPNITMVENFLRYFRTKGKDYNGVRDEKVHREEIKAVNAQTGGLNFDEKPEKELHQIGAEKENEVLERWNQKPKEAASNFAIQKKVYDHVAGNENEVGKKVVEQIDKTIQNVKAAQTKADPPKIVEKVKTVYKYQLKIADGNLAFQFAFLWGLVKINFVYRGKGAQ